MAGRGVDIRLGGADGAAEQAVRAAGGLLKTGVELFVWHAEAFRLVGGKACLTFRAVEHVGGEVVLDSPQGPAGGTAKNFGHGEVSQMQS